MYPKAARVCCSSSEPSAFFPGANPWRRSPGHQEACRRLVRDQASPWAFIRSQFFSLTIDTALLGSFSPRLKPELCSQHPSQRYSLIVQPLVKQIMIGVLPMGVRLASPVGIQHASRQIARECLILSTRGMVFLGSFMLVFINF